MGEEAVRNAAERLRKLLRAAQYPQLGALRLEAGDVSELLRVLHFLLLDSSRVVAQFLVDRGYDLFGKTDARFVESAFRLLRDEFRCFPSLSVAQFLSPQFVARRLAIVADAAAAVAHKRQELQRRKRREEAVWSQPQQSSNSSRREPKATVENHVLPSAVANHAASILQHLKLQQTETRRRIRRASSEMPVQVDGGGGENKFTGRQVDTRASHAVVQFASEPSLSEQDFAVDNAVQTESRPQPKSCRCPQDSDKLTKAIGDLSRQLSEMSSALMNKISSVETRLGRLENQMHDVQATVEEQREFAWKSSTEHSNKLTGDPITQNEAELPIAAEKPDKRRMLNIDPPCAWPPQPSVFERY